VCKISQVCKLLYTKFKKIGRTPLIFLRFRVTMGAEGLVCPFAPLGNGKMSNHKIAQFAWSQNFTIRKNWQNFGTERRFVVYNE